MYRYFYDNEGEIVRKVKFQKLCPITLDYDFIDSNLNVKEHLHIVSNGEITEKKVIPSTSQQPVVESINDYQAAVAAESVNDTDESEENEDDI
jgi:hypothetical protein